MGQESKTRSLKLLRLLNEVGTEALRKWLDGVHAPPTWNNFLLSPSTKTTLTGLFKKKVINKNQWEKLYPISRAISDSRTYDISLLFVLLRNVCGLLPFTDPKWASKPPSNDKSVEANIARIHWHRNEVIHNNSSGIDQATFDKYWKEIADSAESLGVNKTDLEALQNSPLDEENYLELLNMWKDEEQNWTTIAKEMSRSGEDWNRFMKTMKRRFKDKSEETSFKTPHEIIKKLAKLNFKGDIEFFCRQYFHGTREWVFKEVDSWVNDTSAARVFVITGVAGIGKSVISAELCRRMERKGQLVGFFFCQHNDTRRRNVKFMLHSLAKGLMDYLPDYNEKLMDHLDHLGMDIERLSNSELFIALLQEPLHSVEEPQETRVIVIDGLDECEQGDHNEALHIITANLSRLPAWLKIVVTSRPEVQTMRRLEFLHPFKLEGNEQNNLDDIKIFARGKLSQVMSPQDLTEAVDLVVQKSEGLMLQAHFFLEAVCHRGGGEMTLEKLSYVLPRGLEEVYEDYMKRLRDSLEVSDDDFFKFLATLAAAREPIPISILSSILRMKEDSRKTQRNLRKAIESVSTLFPIREDRIHIFHKSLVEWLTTCEGYVKHDFAVNVNDGHRTLSDICFEVCQAVKGIPCTDDSNPLQAYALRYGLSHATETIPNEDHMLSRVLETACNLKLLLAKLSSPSSGVCTVIEELFSVLRFVSNEPKIEAKINNCIQILRRHAETIKQNPSLFYQCLVNKATVPELALEAQQELIKNQEQISWFQVSNKEDFKGPLLALHNCNSYINCIAVSPNEKLVACGCTDGSTVLWSVETGRQLWARRARRSEVCCCLFSPDGSNIIYGRLDKVFSIDGTEKELHPKILYEFESLTFSPNKKKLLSRDFNGALYVWDFSSGKLLFRLMGHRFGASSCQFSPCGRFIISVDKYKLFQWSNSDGRRIGKPLQTPPGDVTQPLLCVSLKEGGTAALYGDTIFKISEEGLVVSPEDVSLHSTIVGRSRDGKFIFMENSFGDDDREYDRLPFAIKKVPKFGAGRNTGAIDVTEDTIVVWEGNSFCLLDNREASQGCQAPVELPRSMCFVSLIEGHSDLLAIYGHGIQTLDETDGKRRCEQVLGEYLGNICSVSQALLATRRNKLELWSADLDNLQQTFELPNRDRFIWRMFVLDVSLILVVTRFVTGAWYKSSLMLLSLATGEFETCRVQERIQNEIFSIDMSSDGTHALICDSSGNHLRLVNIRNGDCTAEATTDEADSPAVCRLSPDGSRALTLHFCTNSISLWETDTLQFLGSLQTFSTDPTLGISFITDTFVVISKLDRSVVLMDTERRSQTAVIEFDHMPRNMAVCRRKGTIAVSMEDGKILILKVHIASLP